MAVGIITYYISDKNISCYISNNQTIAIALKVVQLVSGSTSTMFYVVVEVLQEKMT